MEPTWVRTRLPIETGPVLAEERITERRASTPRPWILFVGEDERALAAAASRFLLEKAGSLPILSPPASPLLPVAVHRLGPPGISGERALYVPRIERGFFELAFSASSPLYLLPKLSQLASEAAPLTFVATALESELDRRAKEVLAQRGLASRFEIHRVAGKSDSSNHPSIGELSPLEKGLTSLDPELRARAYASAVDSAPEDALPHLFLASSLLERRKLAEAVASLRKAIELDAHLASATYELGKALIQADDMQGALASFRRTVALLPEYSSAWGNLGAALGEVQDLAGASDALHRAVELDPLSHALHSNLGVAFRDQGRLAEAETEFHRALELEPGFVFGYYNLAQVLFLDGRYPEAIETFEKAQSMDRSRSPRQALLLAITRLAAGDTEEAHRDYREVFERLSGPMKNDMRTVAEWDLKQLAQRTGVTAELKEASELLRSLA